MATDDADGQGTRPVLGTPDDFAPTARARRAGSACTS